MSYSAAATSGRFEDHRSAPSCAPASSALHHFPRFAPLFSASSSPPLSNRSHLGVGHEPAHPPRSQDHQVIARHNKFGTFPVPKDMNNTKKSATDAKAVATRIAAKNQARRRRRHRLRRRRRRPRSAVLAHTASRTAVRATATAVPPKSSSTALSWTPSTIPALTERRRPTSATSGHRWKAASRPSRGLILPATRSRSSR